MQPLRIRVQRMAFFFAAFIDKHIVSAITIFIECAKTCSSCKISRINGPSLARFEAEAELPARKLESRP